jgi:hypothetical protein
MLPTSMRKPMAHRGRTLGIAGGIVAVVVVVGLLLSACSGVAAFGDSLNRKLRGVSATMTTYNQSGKQLDRVHGKSFNVSRRRCRLRPSRSRTPSPARRG